MLLVGRCVHFVQTELAGGTVPVGSPWFEYLFILICKLSVDLVAAVVFLWDFCDGESRGKK